MHEADQSSRRAERRRDAEAGFTLLEVIVVLSIIGLIMSMVAPRVLGYLSDSKVKTARIQMETLGSAAELFFVDNARYPLEREGLQALVRKPETLEFWNGPYLRTKSLPLDPWGKPYVYTSPDRGRSYSITSTGLNERVGKEPAGSGSGPPGGTLAQTSAARPGADRDDSP